MHSPDMRTVRIKSGYRSSTSIYIRAYTTMPDMQASMSMQHMFARHAAVIVYAVGKLKSFHALLGAYSNMLSTLPPSQYSKMSATGWSTGCTVRRSRETAVPWKCTRWGLPLSRMSMAALSRSKMAIWPA